MLLDSRHREQLIAHLLALNPEDRSDRFIGAVSDDYVRRYVDGIGYARDVLIGALQATHPRERGRALLVHGAGGDSYQWLPSLIPALWNAGFSVCAPTLPGHGRGGDPTRANLDDLQACVSDSAERFGPTLLLGHS